MKKVMVFGTFDGLHEGHVDFLKQAKKCAPRLVVVVARDEAVRRLKGHAPRYTLQERIDMLKTRRVADEVVPGDNSEGAWHVVKQRKPAIIALGYDQHALKASLELALEKSGFTAELRMMKPRRRGKVRSHIARTRRGRKRVNF